MPSSTTKEIALPRKVEYLSTPADVSMADRWFEIASLEHFWIRRRFEVLRRLASHMISNAKEMAEIGCGHGLLQRQIEDCYEREVAGFDLHELPLKQNVSRRSSVFCYDIFQMDPSLRSRFDAIFLFDVLEHISREDGFLEALLFHLAPSGKLVINVPAGQWAYSEYDRKVGHVRRYSIGTLLDTAGRNGLRVREWTYWGLPLIPTLALRKLWLRVGRNKREVISSGFEPSSRAINLMLGLACRCEVIPQRLMGTSLMAILERTD
jgi:SAM-dependent methyltransferase